MFIADTYYTIKDTKEYPMTEGLAEKLDEMLNQYNVPHFFSLPIQTDENGCALNDDDCLCLGYESKDEMLVSLVYALWLKTERGVTDEIILKGFQKKANRVLTEN